MFKQNPGGAPAFAESAVVTAAWTSDTTATISFDAATDNEFVRYYEVNVYKDESTTPSTYQYSSFYYLGLTKMPDMIRAVVEKLDSKSNYRFEIIAVDSWGNERAIVVSLEKKENR